MKLHLCNYVSFLKFAPGVRLVQGGEEVDGALGAEQGHAEVGRAKVALASGKEA